MIFYHSNNHIPHYPQSRYVQVDSNRDNRPGITHALQLLLDDHRLSTPIHIIFDFSPGNIMFNASKTPPGPDVTPVHQTIFVFNAADFIESQLSVYFIHLT
jgi:hypothetical protein